MKSCIDCGKPCHGLRCMSHARAAVLLDVAQRRDTEDRLLLSDVSAGLTAARLGVRLGRSRQWADRLIKKAERRQRVLAGAK